MIKLQSDSPNLNLGLLNKIEQTYNFKFPIEYVEFLETQNGGYFEDRVVIPIEQEYKPELHYYFMDGDFEIDYIAGIWENNSDETSLLYLIEMAKDWNIFEFIIPICGDGHTWIGFNRGKNSKDIIFLTSEDKVSFSLAPDFKTFVSNLRITQED